MLELMALFAVLTVGCVVIGVLALVGLLLKAVFKVLLFPLWLIAGLFKLIFVVLLAAAALVFAPLLLAFLLLVVLPLIALGGLVALGWGLAAA